MKEDVKQPTAPSSTMDINRELAPHRWNLVRERAQITGLGTERWYSEQSCFCTT